MSHVITRKLEFDAGHRVYQHESKCNNIHGHRYTVEISVTAFKLDSLGRVVDFSVIKSLVGKWIDDQWDHGMILSKDDPLVEVWTSFTEVGGWGVTEDVSPQKYYVMDNNPTAENMAEHLFHVAQTLLTVGKHNIKVVKVKLWETPNCFAVYEDGDL